MSYNHVNWKCVGGGGREEGGGEVGYLDFQLFTPLLHAPVLRQQVCMLRVTANLSLQGLCDAASCRVHLHTLQG